jgi:hypothetical protein
MTKQQTFLTAGPVRASLNLAIVAVLSGGATAVAAHGKDQEGQQGRGGDHGQAGKGQVCAQTAQVGFTACGKDVQDNYLVAVAKCLNLTNGDEKETCLADAKSTRQDETTQCGEVRDARLELCGALTMGGGPYDPPINPKNFVSADKIVGNKYFPLTPGTKIYENTAGERITVTVTGDTTQIMGVPVVVVTDVVKVGDKTTENTVDWFAQDKAGNVWYFGESTMAANAENKLISVDGSWEAGVDGAKPGIVMPAGTPTVGDVYRQEWLLNDAEDAAEILSNTESETAPAFGCSGDCVKTHDYSPIEPDASESKFYAPDVGVIVTLDDNDPNFREYLVEIK